MSGTKSSSRAVTGKKDNSLRNTTKCLVLGRRTNPCKETNNSKACECLLKSNNWKTAKCSQNSKLPHKKSNMKCSSVKDPRKKVSSTNHREKVVIVSKRSSSVSVVKSCKLRKSVSVKKVSYSTSVVLSSDEDSDSEEESDDEDEDDEEEEEKQECSNKRRKKVLKHTTSKVKSSIKETKKTENKTSKKAKAIKLLCDKLASSSKGSKALCQSRELRPRFPYSVMQELPTARTHRMASLNALAKVHVLYENEGRTVEGSMKDADEHSLIEFLNENSDEDLDNEDKAVIKKESKAAASGNQKKTDKSKTEEKQKISKKEKEIVKAKVVRRGKKRKLPEVEIIDTRICKRMASLNAQAILAASYLHEPKVKRIDKQADKYDSSSDTEEDYDLTDESKSSIKMIKTEKISDDEDVIEMTMEKQKIMKQKQTKVNTNEKSFKNTSTRNTFKLDPSSNQNNSSEVTIIESRPTSVQSTVCTVENNVASTAAATKVQYTEVTKVQINNDNEIKEESKSERKIERILANEDVAITQMYHYQSKTSNESYCVQMQATYKPASKNSTPSNSRPSSSAMRPFQNEPLPSQNYYGHNSMMPPQVYPVNSNVGPLSSVSMDRRLPRQYGSAFTVPSQRNQQHLQFPPNKYGYYQPAGPLIQPAQDHTPIHKPVPYHAQPNCHQTPQRPQQPNHQDRLHNLNNFPPLQNKTGVPTFQAQMSRDSPSKASSFSRSQNIEGDRSRNQNNTNPNTSFGQLPKHVRSPVMPTLHNFRNYQTQKRVMPFRSQPFERKEHISSKATTFGGYQSGNIPPRQGSKDVLQSESYSASRSSDHMKNANRQEIKNFDFRANPNSSSTSLSSSVYGPSTPSSMYSSSNMYSRSTTHFPPFNPNSSSRDTVQSGMQEIDTYPMRPPSVIEIVEDSPRDTKTYIQLEVPKNSHREKIVVVDVEDDEIESKHIYSRNRDLNKQTFNKTQESVLSEKKMDHLTLYEGSNSNAVQDKQFIKDCPVKTENKCSEDTPNVSASISKDNIIEEKANEESPDIVFMESKKKKESAVIRRARLHGKQRTFRDCYNRPLEQLSKAKKSDASTSYEPGSSKEVQPFSSMPRLVLPKLEKAPMHGWSWEGSPLDKQVYLSNDDPPCIRRCFPSMRHVEGDIIHERDCVFLRSGPRKTDLPFVAKVTALWENPANGEMTMSLLWYYRPEHTETGKKLHSMEDEVFASKHRDMNSVACIEDKCYVLTYSEYCRYRMKCRMVEESAGPSISLVPAGEEYFRKKHLPPLEVSPDLVLFCRKVYDYRQKRLLKNPM